MVFRIQSQPSYSKLRRTCSLLVTAVVDKCKWRTLGCGLFPKIILIHNYSHDRPIWGNKWAERGTVTAPVNGRVQFSLPCPLCVRATSCWALSRVCHFWGSLLLEAWPPGIPCASEGHWLVISPTEHCQSLLSRANPSKGKNPRVLGTKILFLFCLRAQSAGEARIIKKWGMAFSAAEQMQTFSFGTMWKEASRWKLLVVVTYCFHFSWHLQETLSEGVYMWWHCKVIKKIKYLSRSLHIVESCSTFILHVQPSICHCQRS